MMLAAIDVETTGLFPTVDRVIEIAILVMEIDGRPVRQFCSLVNPARDVGATSIHGISAEDVSGAPTFAALAGHVVKALDGVVALVGHNVWFDNSFLKSEFARLGHDWPEAPTLCTMRLAGGGRLSQCCEDFGVALPTLSHSAEADAKASADLLLRLLPDSPRELARLRNLRPVTWPRVPISDAAPIGRERARASSARSAGYLNELFCLAGASVEPDDSAGMQYLDLLGRLLDDRRLDSGEVDHLRDVARDLGLSGRMVRELHLSFLKQLVVEATRDNVVTDLEARDLARVVSLLGLTEAEVSAAVATATPASSVCADAPAVGADGWAGKRVCFTGESQCFHGSELLTREKAAELASAYGLIVVESVTKKLDILVVADPFSQSGKAVKARKYGIRVLHEPAFWGALGAEVR
jgi:DNA polymerase-3 subunit epsilon